MIELRNDMLVCRFPEVHADAVCHIGFQRTLRIPDDNRDYPLPPGLGRFPLRHVDDHLDSAPESWGRHGGVFLPMYQAEALWLHFDTEYPMAVKVAAGKIDALTGDDWINELSPHRQDYLVIPDQPWLDGFSVGKGLIRQFVAMPLGQGFTAEEQLTGEGRHGGLQLVVYPMQASRYENWRPKEQGIYCMAPQAPEMGLAPGGLMRQEIHSDNYGFDAWTGPCAPAASCMYSTACSSSRCPASPRRQGRRRPRNTPRPGCRGSSITAVTGPRSTARRSWRAWTAWPRND